MLAVVCTLVWVSNAGAQAPSFSITPLHRQPYFVFTATPGGTVTGRLRVINVSSTPGMVRLFAVDSTTGQTGGAVYLSQDAARHDVGHWITLATPTVTLGAHGSSVVPFTVHVPTQVRHGQHLGGLVAAPVLPVSTHRTRRGKSSFQVKINEISVVAVLMRLPGPQTQQMSLSGVSAAGRPGYQTVMIKMGNAGNTLVKVSGNIVIETSGGRTALSQPFTLGTFVPRTHVAYPVYVRGARLRPGTYRARVHLTYGSGHSLTRTFGLEITAHQVRETYGSTGLPAGDSSAAGGGSALPGWVLALGAAALLGAGVGGSGLYFRARYRQT